MKLLVFSDSHGADTLLAAMLHREVKAPWGQELLVFLGDGVRDLEGLTHTGSLASLASLAVRGNCDLFCDEPELRLLTLEGVKLMMLHGHRYGVKSGLSLLAGKAAAEGADLVLYGHTHIPAATKTPGDAILFNPGSVRQGCYGVVTLAQGSISYEHKTL